MAIDESTDITSTSQFLIFARGVMHEFEVSAELIGMSSLANQTKSNGTFTELIIEKAFGKSLSSCYNFAVYFTRRVCAVVSTVIFFKSRCLNHWQLKNFFEYIESEYGGLFCMQEKGG